MWLCVRSLLFTHNRNKKGGNDMRHYEFLGNVNMKICGGKAKGLFYLNSIGMNIPETLVIPNNISLKDYEKEIKAFVNKIVLTYGNVKFAVRSSAINEDGINCSWAGMYDTFLNVQADNVFDTIKSAIQYKQTERNNCYKNLIEDGGNTEKISVVLQRMIVPKVSGVCFTLNPVNKDSDETIIEVVEGLGEKLVSGQVTPQMYILDKQGTCLGYDPGECEKVLLTDDFLKKFRLEVSKIQKHIYEAADIEFAVDGEEIYFLQVRPITALYKKVG